MQLKSQCLTCPKYGVTIFCCCCLSFLCISQYFHQQHILNRSGTVATVLNLYISIVNWVFFCWFFLATVFDLAHYIERFIHIDARSSVYVVIYLRRNSIFFTITKNAVMNIPIHVSLCTYSRISPGNIPRSLSTGT